MTEPVVESLIAVVVGNTSIGMGVFDQGARGSAPVPRRAVSVESRQTDFQAISKLLPARSAAWFVASVYEGAADRLRQWAQAHRPQDVVRQLRHDDFPIRIDVRSPERVGADRLAGAVAANALRRSDRSAIVVDAGTAITVNAVSADGRFLGGAILPGRKMAAAALCSKTDLLPLVEVDDGGDPGSAIGRSTTEAIRSGLYWGTIGALHRLIDEMEKSLNSPTELFLTGGGMGELVGGMGANAKFVPDLVLRGIALAAADRQTGDIRHS